MCYTIIDMIIYPFSWQRPVPATIIATSSSWRMGGEVGDCGEGSVIGRQLASCSSFPIHPFESLKEINEAAIIWTVSKGPPMESSGVRMKRNRPDLKRQSAILKRPCDTME